MKFDPPMYLNIRDGIEMEATYYNYTDEVVEFGLLSIDEMMISFGLYFPGEQLNSDEVALLPIQLMLHPNFPNTFTPITTLRYDLPNDGLVNITIYDMMARKVKTLVNSSQTAGFKAVQWNATNERNEPVSTGLYLYTIQVGDFRQTRKMVLLK